MIDIVNLALPFNSFKNYTTHFFIKKKIETNFMMSKVLFEVAQPKQNKKTIVIIKGSTGSRNPDACFELIRNENADSVPFRVNVWMRLLLIYRRHIFFRKSIRWFLNLAKIYLKYIFIRYL